MIPFMVAPKCDSLLLKRDQDRKLIQKSKNDSKRTSGKVDMTEARNAAYHAGYIVRVPKFAYDEIMNKL